MDGSRREDLTGPASPCTRRYWNGLERRSMVSGYARTAPGQVPLDTTRPNIARVYDYWLGGKDNFAADREEADRLLGIWPPMAKLARETREFLTRSVAW